MVYTISKKQPMTPAITKKFMFLLALKYGYISTNDNKENSGRKILFGWIIVDRIPSSKKETIISKANISNLPFFLIW